MPDIKTTHTLHRVPGDGDCFFLAMALAINALKPTTHINSQNLRAMCKAFALQELEQSDPENYRNTSLCNLNTTTTYDQFLTSLQEYCTRIEYTPEMARNEAQQDNPIAQDLVKHGVVWGNSLYEGDIICQHFAVSVGLLEHHRLEYTDSSYMQGYILTYNIMPANSSNHDFNANIPYLYNASLG